jgi:tetratricopeptide (TPR) repeat protein
VDWGHATSLTAVCRLLLRRDYGTFALTVEGARVIGASELAAQAWRFFRAAVGAFGAPGVLLAVIGAAAWKRSGLKLGVGVAAAWIVAAGPLFLFLGRPGFDAQTSAALERFYLLPLLGVVAFIAAGIAALSLRVPAFGLIAAVVAGISMIPEAFAASRRNDYLAYDYGRAILRALPRDSVLVMDGGDDTFYSLMFLTAASGLRPDLELRDRGGVVFPGGYGSDFRALSKDAKEIRRRETERRWFAAGRLWYSTLNENVLPGVVLASAGLLRRPSSTASPFHGGPALTETLALRWSREAAAARYRDRALAAFFPYQRGVEALSRGDTAAGVTWIELSADLAPDALWVAPSASYVLAMSGYRAVARREWLGAERAYRAGAALEPEKAEPLTNLGVTLERAGRTAEAEETFREAIRREPRAARPWAALGARLWADGRWSEAAGAFDSAAALDPSDARSTSWAGQARHRAAGRK